jgi:hypothetical protein
MDKKDLSFSVDFVPIIKINDLKAETYKPAVFGEDDKIHIKITFDANKKPKNLWLISLNKYQFINNGSINYSTSEPISKFDYNQI